MNQASIAQAIVNLDAWLETTRQPGGYGGPVSHWWQNRFLYTGPGLDWRYEGILTGYALVYEKTGSALWKQRLDAAATDLIDGQREDGSYTASKFEINPGMLGTPHEAAASLGLLRALPYLDAGDEALRVVQRNLQNIADKLWDGAGFNDRPGVPSRVPNKLATLARAFMCLGEISDERPWLMYAKSAMDDLLKFQVGKGRLDGAVGQGSPSGETKYFPYYIARCVPALLEAARVFGDGKYERSALRAVDFLRRTMHADGSWPQVLYGERHRAEWPRWSAGVADILQALVVVGDEIPAAAMSRFAGSQLRSGGFQTASGFGSQTTQRLFSDPPDFRDLMPIVGWNDKAFAFLAESLAPGDPDSLPESDVAPVELQVSVRSEVGKLIEDDASIEVVVRGNGVYEWRKLEPWAAVCGEHVYAN